MDWSGKVVVVTGAASGIGAATAELFASGGAAVALLDIDADAVAQSAARAGSKGGRTLGIAADVTSEQNVAAAVERVLAAFGRIDVLVNNAGIMIRHKRLEDWTVAEFSRISQVNLTSLFITTLAVYPAMARQGGGSIVNISSTGAVMPFPASPPYAAAKAGVMGLTISLAALLAPHNIRVSAILPDITDTPMTLDSPARKPGSVFLQPGDIARGIRYAAGAERGGFFSVERDPGGGKPRLHRVEDPVRVPMPDAI